ncbi:MAG: 2-dehydropantoate 2-reductase [Paracoccaceae bacterium]
MSEPKRIAIAGAGAIGLFVGGRLSAAGHDVIFLGRRRLADEISAAGLHLTDVEGDAADFASIRYETDAACLAEADVILVTVKSSATSDMGKSINQFAPSAKVISLQNGVTNAEMLRAVAPLADVRSGVVAFNVVQTGPGTFRKATSGGVQIEDASGTLVRDLNVPELPVAGFADLKPVQWGKLLVNLNNALNALSGDTLHNQLQSREWRRVLANQMQETLAVLAAAGIKPARFTAAPATLVPYILRLPTPLFRRIASQMLKIDPAARSSMQDDLHHGRLTEIDALQGAVLKLAEIHNVPCPVIQRVVDAIRAAEKTGPGAPRLQPSEI